ncbi:hypothetical protein [Ralstonia mannitolilytica]|uniref:Uncharacterized protein n=2 Tax=Ralstonia TaxID=48736 RepID=A0AAD2AW96_9RALS|nr:hypothetical protein [Ralstonia mannitolilytica]MBY4721002.1 hypothetical protein [Ralstonia mannitolilytica]CAJ0692999.1 hypothetical protein R77591_04013 [Ralstonia mannitolilytica]CAJ0894049.1 hypothetical protein R77569_04365 [Ralstonia mannitolilytica]
MNSSRLQWIAIAVAALALVWITGTQPAVDGEGWIRALWFALGGKTWSL